LLTDLQSWETPKLRELSFTLEALVGVTLDSWAATIRRFISHPGITHLELRRIREGLQLLSLLEDAGGKLHRVELIGPPAAEAVNVSHLRKTLESVQFEVPESAALAKALTALGLKANGPSEETLAKKKKAAATRAERAARRARDDDEDRYDEIAE